MLAVRFKVNKMIKIGNQGFTKILLRQVVSGDLQFAFISSLCQARLQSVKKKRAYQGCTNICEIILTVQQMVAHTVFSLCWFSHCLFSLLVALLFLSHNADRSQVQSLDPSFYTCSLCHFIWSHGVSSKICEDGSQRYISILFLFRNL